MKRYYNEFDFNNNVKKYPKIPNISAIFPFFNIVVSRAGASTINELLFLAIPMVLFPSKNVSLDHQRKNAKYIESNGACMNIDGLKNDVAVEKIYNLLISGEKCKTVTQNAKKLYKKYEF